MKVGCEKGCNYFCNEKIKKMKKRIILIMLAFAAAVYAAAASPMEARDTSEVIPIYGGGNSGWGVIEASLSASYELVSSL